MAKVILRQEAINDLNEIWLYTFEKWSEKQADTYYSLLEYACLEIGNNAELGKEYNGVETSLFGLKTGKHIIFYRIITKQEIEIIRILHERMDLKNSFD
jgi:toxin ParE1/3/4